MSKVILKEKLAAYFKTCCKLENWKLQHLYTPYQMLAFQIIENHYTVDLVLLYARRLFDVSNLNCAEKHTNLRLFLC